MSLAYSGGISGTRAALIPGRAAKGGTSDGVDDYGR